MPPKDFAYMRIPISLIPDESMQMYKLKPLVKKGNVYVRIEKGMYGLPQAGIIANKRLTKFLEPQGYSPCPITPGLWQHKTRDIKFSLVVDDFGIKYTNKVNAHHLIDALSKDYVLKVKWDGTKYCGLTFTWDYDNHTVNISTPDYIDQALQQFAHPSPAAPQHSLHAWAQPTYGAKQEFPPAEDLTAELPVADKTRIQEIILSFSFTVVLLIVAH
jgi:hypothetical protein